MLGHIFAKPKDRIAKEQRKDAIYFIPCNDCNQEYIGQTNRQFCKHLKITKRLFSFQKKEISALSKHACLTNHEIAWEN